MRISINGALVLARGELGGPNLRIVSLGHERIPDLVAAFERRRDLGISFTDASHLVLMDTLAIDYLATFDRRLQALARNVPG